MSLAAALAVGAAPAAQAVSIGMEGCTPGYWKNHTDSWEETTPAHLVQNLYSSAPSSVAGLTLEQALAGGGGRGVDGASTILARAAVAAWLNAAHEGLGYPWRRFATGLEGRDHLVATVNAAFASGDRATMLALAERLDADNNLGCPL
ncbi:hypothetical protein [Ornithinicoccus halotolerans]|uniref:hypothetical protein n=1 Tax=Ornithinicoccus halotolerans TaxID=1748220 RepID=UPI0012969FAC|nr:hypothetical protein [Ornithinicoccus halotolerans]